ncbi:hypothetical protein RA280_48185, partial [Cupriavidus sp. CV2]|uniref:hypothetical protein n=1 Tax=Cupriavidus ulmosensis TaxID=3065913 RepID=UPI00296AFB02
KAMPAPQMVGHLLKQPVIEVSKDIAAEFAASLGEGLFTDSPAQGVLAGERREELIEFSLNAHAQVAKHEGDQGGQGELALTGECAWMFGMTGKIVKDLGVQILGKRSEQIGQGHERQAKIEK